MSEKSVLRTVSIGLRFPFSISRDDAGSVFVLSYNCAIHSGYLKHLLENEEVVSYREIEIPRQFYEGLRYVDIEEFIRLWKGEPPSCILLNGRYCWRLIAKLCQALVLSDDLDFANKLENMFPPYTEKEPSVLETVNLQI